MPVSHRMTNTREYGIWCGMIRRCENIHDTSYPRYGGRGITVCARWREDFAVFYLDMGASPSSDHSIERRDNAGNYEPGNCIWATRAEQARNRRSTHLIQHAGRTLCITDWAREAGIKPGTLGYRLRSGMTMSEAMAVPVGSDELRPRGAAHWRIQVKAAAALDKAST